MQLCPITVGHHRTITGPEAHDHRRGVWQRGAVPRADLYLSADVEADGPVPGLYSMSSLGLVVAGRYDGSVLERPRHPETFYRELKPVSDRFDPAAAAVSGLDREELRREGAEPARAMADLAGWVDELARGYDARPVFAAYPASFDWMFVYHYLIAYHGSSPFGFSGVLDMKSFYAARSGAVIGAATKRSMPRHLLSSRPHTHHALDDAREQADLLANLLMYRPGLAPLPVREMDNLGRSPA
jgi:hypothetical protein